MVVEQQNTDSPNGFPEGEASTSARVVPVTTEGLQQAMKDYLKATGQERRPVDPRALERVNGPNCPSPPSGTLRALEEEFGLEGSDLIRWPEA